MEVDSVKALAAVGNPDTGEFTEKLNTLNQISNHTAGICFDRENIYLLEGKDCLEEVWLGLENSGYLDLTLLQC